MKKSTTNYLNSISKKEMDTLTTIVHETVASGNNEDAAIGRAFSSADLWNIHRTKRMFVQRRYIL